MSLTPAEQDTLKTIEATQAAGGDPFGDNDTEEVTEAVAEAEEAAEEQAAQAQEGETTAEEQAQQQGESTTEPADDIEALAEIANGKPESDPLSLLSFKSEAPQDYKAQRAALMSEKAQAMKKLMEGEIDADAYAAIEADVSDKLEDLAAARIRAETLAEANQQVQAQTQQAVITSLIARAKADGVDYTKELGAVKQFDVALAAVSADPDNANKPFAELAELAHRTVAALRGVVLKQQPQSASKTVSPEAPDRRPKVQVPPTLRNVPSASTPNANGGINEQLAHLKGQDFEAAFARLSPAQRAQLLEE